jgi:Tol biopolymer transport system component
MNRIYKPVAVAAMAVLLTTTLPAQQPDAAKMALKAAIDKEIVDGDLRAAIALYNNIATTHKANRAVAAQALVRMAQCHEKLGNAEARKIYERVVREYGDQKEAMALARSRLSGNTPHPNVGVVTRQVWTKSSSTVARTMSVSPDGRYIAFPHETGNLGLHNLTTGQDRLLTTTGNWGNEPEYASSSVFSPDGTRVAYYWERNAKGREPRIELRVVGTGPQTSPRVLYSNDESWVVPFAWSPDGKWIAVSVTRNDQTRQIGLISAADGTLRVLKSVDWRGPRNMAFSPDSVYLAYDIAADQDSVQHDVFVLALDGSREVAAITHGANDVVVGWARDEKHLLFSSNRSGRLGLWALPFINGKVQSSAIPVSADFGKPIGSTHSGTIYYSKPAAISDVYLAEIDLSTGKVLRPPTRPIDLSVGFNYLPDLSPDGKHLSYVFVGSEAGIPRLAIRSLATGETRVLNGKWSRLYSTAPPRWAPNGESLLTSGIDTKGRKGIFSIDAQTGHLKRITPDEVMRIWPMWAPDGKSFFWKGPSATIRHDIASGQGSEFYPGTCRSISPDGRYVACTSQDGRLLAVPVDGTQPKELARFPPEVRFLQLSAWTPDSAAVVYGIVRGKESKTAELWVAPLGGVEYRP